MMTTAIIGAGNMGGALYRGLETKNLARDVFLCDTDEEKIAIAPKERRITDITAAAERAECIILAVKPQSFTGLMEEVQGAWSDKLILSIMAGMTMEVIRKKTGATRIVRAMPNLGALKGESMAGWCATDDVSEGEREHAENILQAVGACVYLEAEKQLDAFTAIAGSGPAYVFALAEELQKAADKLGITEEESALVARKVIAAGSALLEEGFKTAGEWREAVTSKGGVTEAVLNALNEQGVADTFQKALDAGVERSRSLSKTDG